MYPQQACFWVYLEKELGVKVLVRGKDMDQRRRLVQCTHLVLYAEADGLGENDQSKICPVSNFNEGYHPEIFFSFYFPQGSSLQKFMSGTSSYPHQEMDGAIKRSLTSLRLNGLSIR